MVRWETPAAEPFVTSSIGKQGFNRKYSKITAGSVSRKYLMGSGLLRAGIQKKIK
jgi:hypothetical protein